MINKYFLSPAATIALVAIVHIATAQTYSSGTEIKKADVNLRELAEYYKLHPMPLVRRMPMDEDDEEERPKHHKAHGAEIHLYTPQENASGSEHPHSAYLPVSPAPNDTFLSTVSAGDIIPPDTHGAVDSQYCVTAINTAIHIQTRIGTNVMTFGLDGFWSSVLPSGTQSFDPRVHYDPMTKRWIMVTDAVNGTTYAGSTIMIAVSATSDPTGTWHMYAISVDPTNATWMDFPNVGYNNKWICVTGNMFSSSGGSGGGGAVVYVFNYASIMNGTGAPYTKITQSASFSISPAITYDATEPSLFALESWNGGSGQLRLWKISGAVGSPTMSSVGYPATSQHWHGGPPGGGDFAPQLGSTNLLNIGDDRITRVMFRNKKLWCSHTVFLPSPGTANRSSIQWWQIDTLANPLQVGRIDDPTASYFYAYSSIAVNAEDDALIGCGVFSSLIHPSAGYTLRMSTDPVDSMRPVDIYRHGQANYYETFGGGRNRWGDYSAATIDPRNDTDFWTIQESSIVGTSPNWDTWWANVQFCPKPSAPGIVVSPTTLCIGASGTYAISLISGATSYVWSVSGTGWSSTPGVTDDTIHVTAGSGAGTITVLAYNSCGEGEARTITVTPATVTARPTITEITPACVGTATVTFSGAVGGATGYSWQATGGGWSGTSGSSAFTATEGTGTGMIICTAINTCGLSTPDTLLVTPNAMPTSSFSEAAHVTNVNVNDNITFTGSAPSGSSYAWNFNSGIATPGTGAGPQSVYWTTAGTYTVSLTVNNNGCASSYADTVHVDGSTGISQLNSNGDGISISPNPNGGSFNILFDNATNKKVSVTVINMLGRVVYSNDYGETNNSGVAVNAGNLPVGNYVVNIIVDGNIHSRKITVSH